MKVREGLREVHAPSPIAIAAETSPFSCKSSSLSHYLANNKSIHTYLGYSHNNAGRDAGWWMMVNNGSRSTPSNDGVMVCRWWRMKDDEVGGSFWREEFSGGGKKKWVANIWRWIDMHTLHRCTFASHSLSKNSDGFRLTLFRESPSKYFAIVTTVLTVLNLAE